MSPKPADGQVVGWGSLSTYHERSACRHTVENSICVHHQCRRRGIGLLLLKELIVHARNLGHRVITPGIGGERAASVALHTKHGFQKVGHLKQVGRKFDRWLDVIYMQMTL